MKATDCILHLLQMLFTNALCTTLNCQNINSAEFQIFILSETKLT